MKLDYIEKEIKSLKNEIKMLSKLNTDIIAKLINIEDNNTKIQLSLQKEDKYMNATKGESKEKKDNSSASEQNVKDLKCDICDFHSASFNTIRKHMNTMHPDSTSEGGEIKDTYESTLECSLCKENCANNNVLALHIKEHLDEIEDIDVESLKNGHEEFECSLCKFKSNDEGAVKKHLIRHVPKPPQKSTRATKTRKEQELIIQTGSLLDLYDDDGNPLYDSTDSESSNNDD